MKFKTLLLLFSTLVLYNSYTQDIPLVYDVENTGVDCTKPPLPTFNELPTIEPLTDPFEWSDGSGRDTNFVNWCHRRAEIKAEIEHYEIGEKPERPDTISANYAGDSLTVYITENGETIVLISKIILPAGDGPFPAVIGMNSPNGSLPSTIFTDRNIARITYSHDQVTNYYSPSNTDPFFMLYPDQNVDNTGQYAAWAWGVSRIIDGLELVSDTLHIDLEHLAVTGCSYAGKMALFAGAFDERIALTIAQEPGGGGAAAWRVSETLGDVETLCATDNRWFKNDMWDFCGNESKLPHDHHELVAMVAPRALLVLGNPDYGWLADESGYVSCMAAHEVWKKFGIPDRFGFSIVGGHTHCALPASQYPEVEAFVDKFILGDTTVNTDVAISPYEYVDYLRWIEWWGTGDPVFPERDTGNSVIITFEAECGTVGDNWNIVSDQGASNEHYVTVKSGTESISEAPSSSEGLITIPFSLDTTGTFGVFARLNCASADDDSYWIKMDDGDFVMYNGLGTSNWQWLKISNYVLSEGEHIITIGYREDGAKLDKICITNYPYAPTEMGKDAENLCVIEPSVVETNLDRTLKGYKLEQNYPNPFHGKTYITFEIPNKSYVSLKVFNIQGVEITELCGKEYNSGKHTVELNSENLSNGNYFYMIKTDKYSATKKMIYIPN